MNQKERLNRLVKVLCRHEGKKSQVSVGDMREVLSLICEEIEESDRFTVNFMAYLGLIQVVPPKKKKGK